MAKIAFAILVSMLALAPVVSLAQNDHSPLTSCRLSQGEPVTTVKQLYGIADGPKEMEHTTPGGTSFQYHLEEYGVWVFFDNRMLVNSLRFDAPFRGKIAGVAIGDTSDQVRSVNGEPARQIRGLPDSAEFRARDEHIHEILNALPDLTPKAQVAETFKEISHIQSAPVEYYTAWLYNPGRPSFVRYDISPKDNRVRTIFIGSCSTAM